MMLLLISSVFVSSRVAVWLTCLLELEFGIWSAFFDDSILIELKLFALLLLDSSLLSLYSLMLSMLFICFH